MKRGALQYGIIAGLMLLWPFFASAQTLPGNDQFTVVVDGKAIPNLTPGNVSVDGKDKPLIPIWPDFGPTDNNLYIGYDKLEFYVGGDNSPKYTWDNTADQTGVSAGVWDICSSGSGTGPAADGSYTIDRSMSLLISGTKAGNHTDIWSADVTVQGKYTCGSPNSNTNKDWFINANLDKSTLTFTIDTSIPEDDFDNAYNVFLYLQTRTQVPQPTETLNEIKCQFHKTTDPCKWNASGSEHGIYTFIIDAKNRIPGDNDHPEIISPVVNLTLDDHQQVTSSTGAGDPGTTTANKGSGGTGKTGGGGTGGGSLLPIKFSLPDISAFKNLTGSALGKAVTAMVFQIMFDIVAILAIIAFIWSGIMYATSFGDPTKMENAKKNLLWAATGVVVLILSGVIITIISNLVKSAV